MPFKSQAQRGFLFANKPKIAKEFASKTPNESSLPEKVGKKKKGFAILSQYLNGKGKNEDQY